MSFDCKCPVSLPHGAVGLSAVCDCGISRSNSLTFSCDFAQFDFKIPYCEYLLQGSAVN